MEDWNWMSLFGVCTLSNSDLSWPSNYKELQDYRSSVMPEEGVNGGRAGKQKGVTPYHPGGQGQFNGVERVLKKTQNMDGWGSEGGRGAGPPIGGNINVYNRQMEKKRAGHTPKCLVVAPNVGIKSGRGLSPKKHNTSVYFGWVSGGTRILPCWGNAFVPMPEENDTSRGDAGGWKTY